MTSLLFSSGRLVPGRVSWQFSRSQIQRVEPTKKGVRFYAEVVDGPWIVGSLFPKHLLSRLRKGGIEPSGPVVPTTWNTVWPLPPMCRYSGTLEGPKSPSSGGYVEDTGGTNQRLPVRANEYQRVPLRLS